MGSDKICTALCTYVQCLSFCQLYSLPLLVEDDSLQRRYGADISLHAASSHSWIISYDLKWYKTSVVFTTVFHRALLSCRWQPSWIVSSVWILAPILCLRCRLRDMHAELFDGYSGVSKSITCLYRCSVTHWTRTEYLDEIVHFLIILAAISSLRVMPSCSAPAKKQVFSGGWEAERRAWILSKFKLSIDPFIK
jgi:hypothetical protein